MKACGYQFCCPGQPCHDGANCEARLFQEWQRQTNAGINSHSFEKFVEINGGVEAAHGMAER